MNEPLEITFNSTPPPEIVYWAVISCNSVELKKFQIAVKDNKLQHYADFRFILDDLDVELSFQKLKELLQGHVRLAQFSQQSFLEQQKTPQ